MRPTAPVPRRYTPATRTKGTVLSRGWCGIPSACAALGCARLGWAATVAWAELRWSGWVLVRKGGVVWTVGGVGVVVGLGVGLGVGDACGTATLTTDSL